MSDVRKRAPSRVSDYHLTCINGDGDDLSASRTYGWVRTHGYLYARVNLFLDASASRSGSVRMQGSHKGKNDQAYDINSANVVVHGNSGSTTIGAGVIRMELAISELPYEIRLKYTATLNGADGDVLGMDVELHN